MNDPIKRTRVIIWGSSTGIWNSIHNTINPFVTEIVGFIDSDPYKQGLIYHGLPIKSISEWDYSDIDFVLIAAYSGMQSIRKQLREIGIPDKKVAPCLSEGLINYYVGDITDMNWKDTLKLFFEPDKLEEITREYIRLSKEYDMIEPFSIDPEHWCYGKHLISHACGGYVNGRPLMYTNSKEALTYTLQAGFDLMECDVCRMPNGEWYLAHDCCDLNRAIEEGYTTISLTELIMALSHNPDISCLIDVKWKDPWEYEDFVIALNKIIVDHSDDNGLKNRLILEVYDEETIQIADNYGYEMFYTEYRNPEKDCFMKTAILCKKYDILVVGMGRKHYFDSQNRISIYRNKGLITYVFSIDAPEEYSRLRESGVYGTFTNTLRKDRITIESCSPKM